MVAPSKTLTPQCLCSAQQHVVHHCAAQTECGRAAKPTAGNCNMMTASVSKRRFQKASDGAEQRHRVSDAESLKVVLTFRRNELTAEFWAAGTFSARREAREDHLRARCIAALLPAGPAPAMITSKLFMLITQSSKNAHEALFMRRERKPIQAPANVRSRGRRRSGRGDTGSDARPEHP